MKHFTKFPIRSLALAFAAIMFATSLAFAAIDPIPGVDIIVKKKPGNVVIHATTDSTGKFTTVYGRPLDPGTYAISFGKLPKDRKYRCSVILSRSENIAIVVNGKTWNSKIPIPITGDTSIEVTIRGKGNSLAGSLISDTTNK